MRRPRQQVARMLPQRRQPSGRPRQDCPRRLDVLGARSPWHRPAAEVRPQASLARCTGRARRTAHPRALNGAGRSRSRRPYGPRDLAPPERPGNSDLSSPMCSGTRRTSGSPTAGSTRPWRPRLRIGAVRCAGRSQTISPRPRDAVHRLATLLLCWRSAFARSFLGFDLSQRALDLDRERSIVAEPFWTPSGTSSSPSPASNPSASHIGPPVPNPEKGHQGEETSPIGRRDRGSGHVPGGGASVSCRVPISGSRAATARDQPAFSLHAGTPARDIET